MLKICTSKSTFHYSTEKLNCNDFKADFVKTIELLQNELRISREKTIKYRKKVERADLRKADFKKAIRLEQERLQKIIDEQSSQLDEKNQDLKQQEDRIRDLMAELDSLNESVAGWRLDNEQKSIEIRELQKMVVSRTQELEASGTVIGEKSGKIKELQKQNRMLEQDIALLQESNSKLRSNLDGQNDTIRSFGATFEEMEKKNEDLIRDLNRKNSSLKRDLNGLEDDNRGLKSQIEKLQIELNNTQNLNQELLIAKNQSSVKTNELITQLDRLEDERKRAETELQDVRHKLQDREDSSITKNQFESLLVDFHQFNDHSKLFKSLFWPLLQKLVHFRKKKDHIINGLIENQNFCQNIMDSVYVEISTLYVGLQSFNKINWEIVDDDPESSEFSKFSL